jgi:hypothetical protein
MSSRSFLRNYIPLAGQFVLGRRQRRAGGLHFMGGFVMANQTQLHQVASAAMPYRALVIRAGST